mmetsp:Transcript_7524/g.13560  ORF Transcript_7524/g.13560 Transcript_7524/m.13560 type:complete len:223 (-) Transcript_7524:47-715(-)
MNKRHHNRVRGVHIYRLVSDVSHLTSFIAKSHLVVDLHEPAILDRWVLKRTCPSKCDDIRYHPPRHLYAHQLVVKRHLRLQVGQEEKFRAVGVVAVRPDTAAVKEAAVAEEAVAHRGAQQGADRGLLEPRVFAAEFHARRHRTQGGAFDLLYSLVMSRHPGAHLRVGRKVQRVDQRHPHLWDACLGRGPHNIHNRDKLRLGTGLDNFATRVLFVHHLVVMPA